MALDESGMVPAMVFSRAMPHANADCGFPEINRTQEACTLRVLPFSVSSVPSGTVAGEL